MKKSVAFLVCLVMCLSLAACQSKTSSGDAAATTTETAQTTTTTEAPTTATTTAADGQTLANRTIQSFIDTIQDQIDTMAASFEDSGLNMKVFARGNSLVYSYQYTMDMGDTSVLKDALESAMDGMSDTFTGILSSMKTVVPSAESVTVEYLDMDGKVILSKEYK